MESTGASSRDSHSPSSQRPAVERTLLDAATTFGASGPVLNS